MCSVGISNRVLRTGNVRIIVKPPPRVSSVHVKRTEREQAKLDQVSAAWVLRERVTRPFTIDKWGVRA